MAGCLDVLRGCMNKSMTKIWVLPRSPTVLLIAKRICVTLVLLIVPSVFSHGSHYLPSITHVWNGLTLSSKSPGLYWNWNKEDTDRSEGSFSSHRCACILSVCDASLSTSCIIYFLSAFLLAEVCWSGWVVLTFLFCTCPLLGGFPAFFPARSSLWLAAVSLASLLCVTAGLSAVVAHLSLPFRWRSWLAAPQPCCRAEEDRARWLLALGGTSGHRKRLRSLRAGEGDGARHLPARGRQAGQRWTTVRTPESAVTSSWAVAGAAGCCTGIRTAAPESVLRGNRLVSRSVCFM